MKIINISIFLCLLAFTSAAVADDHKSAVSVAMKVPDPGWKISIRSMYVNQGKLLVVCEAKHNGGINLQVISEAKASATIDKKTAALPREIYLLGKKWGWGDGYTAVTPAQLKKIIAGGQQVYSAVENKAPEPSDFIGLSSDEAKALADKHKIPNRVVMIDGKHLPTTRDYRPNRLNFSIEKGKVTKVSKG